MRTQYRITLFAMTAFSCAVAQAGGLTTATTAVTEISTWMYTFIGACAVMYLLFKGAQACADKIQWMDFLSSVGQVALVGSVPTLGVWAWTLLA